MNAPLIRNPLGLATIALVCGGFWLAVGCAVAHADPAEDQLQSIDSQTQRDVTYAHAPRWIDATKGDCTVFAIHNAHALEQAGLDAHVWAVRTEDGGLHAVAVSGQWVLDQRFARVQRRDVLERYGYRFITDYGPL